MIMATSYKTLRIRCVSETLDSETRRYVKHPPRAFIELRVGKRERLEECPLNEAELLALIEQAAQAIRKLKGSLQ